MTDWSKRMDAGLRARDSFCECEVPSEDAAQGISALLRALPIVLMQEEQT
jgi:hypothetical protein